MLEAAVEQAPHQQAYEVFQYYDAEQYYQPQAEEGEQQAEEEEQAEEVSHRFSRAHRFNFKQLHHLDLHHFRCAIDDLSIDEVVFDPYADVRQHYPLHDMAFYRGWLVFSDTAVRYMPDRVFWQFGFVQQIPRAPLGDRPLMPIILARLQSWLPRAQRLRRAGIPIDGDLSFVMADDYLLWYVTVSRPRLTPMPMDAEPAAEDMDADAPADAEPPAEDMGAEGVPAPGHQTLRESCRAKILHAMSFSDMPDGQLEYLLGALADLDLMGD